MRPVDLEPGPGYSLKTLAWDYAPNFEVPEHAHKTGQLIYAIAGVMEIHSGQTAWWIPPNFAVWIPARLRHRISMKGAVSMRTLYIRTSRATGAPQTTEVRRVSPLLRELILECVRLGQLRYGNPLHRAIRSLILDQLRMARPLAASVTMPSDSRAVKVAEALLAHPGQSASLHTVCAAAGASVRTIERIFARELGVSIENWRRQVRLMKALEGIVRGVPVKQIAFELGYRQASPFIEMFRRTVGTTPGAWLARDGKI